MAVYTSTDGPDFGWYYITSVIDIPFGTLIQIKRTSEGDITTASVRQRYDLNRYKVKITPNDISDNPCTFCRRLPVTISLDGPVQNKTLAPSDIAWASIYTTVCDCDPQHPCAYCDFWNARDNRPVPVG